MGAHLQFSTDACPVHQLQQGSFEAFALQLRRAQVVDDAPDVVDAAGGLGRRVQDELTGGRLGDPLRGDVQPESDARQCRAETVVQVVPQPVALVLPRCDEPFAQCGRELGFIGGMFPAPLRVSAPGLPHEGEDAQDDGRRDGEVELSGPRHHTEQPQDDRECGEDEHSPHTHR